MTSMLQLPDGCYDVLVVDATADANEFVIELTILSGERKGEVVGGRAMGLDVDELELLGLPGTLDVENGVPRFTIDQ